MDSLTDIAVFVQVVESGSFTKAAERLALSKAVISKYVNRLEERLGARLLNRTTRRLSLTEVGQTFYQGSLRGLNELYEAEAEVSRLQDAPRGTLRLSAPMSFGILHIAPALPDFMKRYPGLKVDMELNDRYLDMINEGFDVAIRGALELPDSSLVSRRLCTRKHVVVAAPCYIEQHGCPRKPEELAGHNVLSFSYQQSALNWSFVGPDQKTVSVKVSSRVQMNNSLALKEMLMAGMGIMRTPTFVVGQDIQEGRLFQLLPDYEAIEGAIYVVYPQRRHLSPKVRAFIDFMVERISETPYWDRPMSQE